MFWFHGGGFHTGLSGTNLHGIDYFTDKDVVLVSIYYDFGLFGSIYF